MRALDPTAFVFCGGEATLEVVGRLVYTVRQVGSAAPVFEYRESMPVTGDHAIPSLGASPPRPPSGSRDTWTAAASSRWWSCPSRGAAPGAAGSPLGRGALAPPPSVRAP